MTKSVRDAAIMLEAMCGHDAKDSTSADLAVPNFEAMLTGDIKGKKIGIPKEYRLDGMPDDIAKLWDEGTAMLKAAGAEIVDISLPHTKYALPAYYVIAPAEASSNLARYDGVRYGQRATLDKQATASPRCTRKPAPPGSGQRCSAALWSAPMCCPQVSMTPTTTARVASAP